MVRYQHNNPFLAIYIIIVEILLKFSLYFVRWYAALLIFTKNPEIQLYITVMNLFSKQFKVYDIGKFFL